MDIKTIHRDDLPKALSSLEIKGLVDLCSSSYNMNPAARRKYVAKHRNTVTIDVQSQIELT